MADAVVSVVKGQPSDEELAALVVVLQALAAGSGGSRDTPAPSGWSSYWRSVRTPLRPGPGVWRASARLT